MKTVVGRITSPKDVHLLILKICEYVALCGNRDFANMTKGKDFERGRVHWITQEDPN